MFQTPDENTAEGWNQIGESLTQQGRDGSYWIQKVVEASLKPATGGVSAGISDLNSSVTSGGLSGGEAQSMLDGCDLNFDMGPDLSTGTQSMIPGGDKMMPGADTMASASGAPGPTVDVGAPAMDAGASVGDVNMDVSHNLVSGTEGGISAPGAPGGDSMLSAPGADSMMSAAPGGDMSSMLPGADAMLPGGDMLNDLGSTIGDMAGQGMPMGFFAQLFQFLFNLLTETAGELGHQAAQAAESVAVEASKKLQGA